MHISSNKIENGDILVPANPGPPGEWPLKRRERINHWAYCVYAQGSWLSKTV